MSNIITKIFGGAAADVTKTIAETVDNLSTTDEEKLVAKERLTSVVMTQLNAMLEQQQKVIVAEASGNWLQRSWRPLLMLAFGFIIIYRYFLAQVFAWPSVDVPSAFWDLLQISIGGYVAGRSLEKVADTVVKNVDISFVKKKNRDA